MLLPPHQLTIPIYYTFWKPQSVVVNMAAPGYVIQGDPKNVM